MKVILTKLSVISLMSLTALGVFVLTVGTLGLGRRFTRVYFLAPMAKGILKIHGFKLSYPDIKRYFDRQVMYMFNHPSNIDIFMNTALGIPNARYLLTTKIIPILPLSFTAWLLGAQFIHPQEEKQKRLNDFIKATETLRRSGDSVFAAPEGSHDVLKQIGPFNRGVFHMALELKIPIVVLFIYIPHESDPFIDIKSYKAGEVRVEFLAELSTEGLSVEHLDKLIQKTRGIYLSKYEAAHKSSENGRNGYLNQTSSLSASQI